MFYQNPNYCGEWRELNSIFKKQDNHILINFVYEYPKEHLLYYSNLIIEEFNKRGYKIKSLDNYNTYFKEILHPKDELYPIIMITDATLFQVKMDDRYLRQCLYNLEEKAMCGGITKEEWKKIYNKYKDRFVLWEGDELNERR